MATPSKFPRQLACKVLVTTAILVSFHVVGTESDLPCPEKCRCETETKTVRCTNLGLTNASQLPVADMPNDTLHLDLSNNSLRDLDFTTLSEKLLQLSTLTVMFNGLKVVPAITGVPMLTTLDVSNNQMTSLQADSFVNLQHLATIIAASNQLTTVLTEPTPPALAKSLRSLQLSDNRLTNTNVSAIRLGDMDAITSLDLSRNLISDPVVNFLTGKSGAALNRLSLSGNRIRQWSPGWLQGARQLTALDLDGNQVSALSAVMWSHTVLASRPNVIQVRVNASANPWHCQCDLKWFAHWLRENVNSTRVVVVGLDDPARYYRCAAPQNLTSLTLLQYEPTDAECPPPEPGRGGVNRFGIVAVTFLGVVAFVTFVGFLAGIAYYSKRNREVIYTNIN